MKEPKLLILCTALWCVSCAMGKLLSNLLKDCNTVLIDTFVVAQNRISAHHL